jgi:NADPH-dependent curcumin reductase CurA
MEPPDNPERSYAPIIRPGDVMSAIGLWKILDSKAEKTHPKGAIVNAWVGWTEYAVVSAEKCRVLQEIPGLSITHYIGGLGGTGLTAYYGLVSSPDYFASFQESAVLQGSHEHLLAS